jgi:chorismate mutase
MDDAAQVLRERRAEIDALDDELCALLARRLTLTDAVGRCKARTGEPPEEPRRQQQRKALLDALAVRYRLPSALVFGLFGLIKAEVLVRHQVAAMLPCAQPLASRRTHCAPASATALAHRSPHR